MNLYVIEISQAGGGSGIIAKNGDTLYFDNEEKARDYARIKVTNKSILALIGWTVISRKKAIQIGYYIKEPKVINPNLLLD
jgi:hypothetical protein